MDKFVCLQTFVKVVEHGGFAAAARVLNSSRSAANKAVLQLEKHLGVPLLTRSTRRVQPTEAGSVFYEKCVSLLEDLEQAEAAISQLQQEPRGRLKINAPMTFGTLQLSPAIARFMARYPDIQVEMVLNDRLVDPISEGFDLTVRIAINPEVTDLVARQIALIPQVLCAAPTYIARHGAPQHPAELNGHTCLHYGHLQMGEPWKLRGTDGEHTVVVKGALCANNGEVLRDAALEGLGITVLPVFLVGQALQQNHLINLMPEFQPPPLRLYVIYPPQRYLSAKTRLLVEFLSARFTGASQFRDTDQ